MKTVKCINQEIEQLIKEASEIRKDKSIKNPNLKIKKIENRVSYRRQMILYLECNPSVEFINSEKQRLENRIEQISKHLVLPPNSSTASTSIIRKEFNKMWGMDKLNDQLKAIDYLLE